MIVRFFYEIAAAVDRKLRLAVPWEMRGQVVQTYSCRPVRELTGVAPSVDG